MSNHDWQSQISQPGHEMIEERDCMVPMRDRIRLACDIFRPKAPGKYPALLSCSLYGKDIQKIADQQRPLSPRVGNGGLEAGDTKFFVSRGYVHVIADVRGSGDSEGTYDLQGTKEQQDGYDLIEWIAAQPWCDGNVGMLGMSYFAIIQLLVAAQQPPHLKAIAPYEAYTDRYRHSAYHGGIFNEGFFHQWWGHVSIAKLKPLIYNSLSEEQVHCLVRKAMETPEVQESPYLHIQLKYPEKNPLMFDFLLQPEDGPFYWERSSYTKFDRIEIPVLLVGRWSAWPIHLAGAFQAWEGLPTPNKKLILMETQNVTGPMRPWRDHQDIILRWYDHWLKGNDTGMMREPPIHLLVKGRNEWRDEYEWPLERTQWTRMWLAADGTLSQKEPANSTADFINDPFLAPSKPAPGMRYATPPLERELEVTGPMALYLSASLDRPDATWIVTIRDEAPDGTSKIVTKGWLRASHRELDAARSKPYRPYHPHTQSVPVPPNEVVEYGIDLRDTSMAFAPGHRLVLEVKGQDTQLEDPIWYHTCNPHPTRHSIYHGAGRSYLLLPVIP